MKINNKNPKDYFFEYKPIYNKLFGSYESNFNNSGITKSKNTIIFYHDQETFEELFTLFSKRHKNYINFTSYLSENVFNFLFR